MGLSKSKIDLIKTLSDNQNEFICLLGSDGMLYYIPKGNYWDYREGEKKRGVELKRREHLQSVASWLRDFLNNETPSPYPEYSEVLFPASIESFVFEVEKYLDQNLHK